MGQQALVVGRALGPVVRIAGIAGVAVRTGGGVEQQVRVALAPRRLHVVVVAQESRHEALGDRLLEDVGGPTVVVRTRAAHVESDQDPRGDPGGVGGELLGKCDVGRRVVLGGVVVDLPAPIFFVADLPVLEPE